MGAYKLRFLDANTERVTLKSEVYAKLPSCNFVGFCNTYIAAYKSESNEHQNTALHFTAYQDKLNTRFQSNEINKEQIMMFARYLEVDKKLALGTIKGIVTRLKYFLKKAYLNGYSVDQSYTEANVKDVESFFIYLNNDDLSRLFHTDKLSPKQEEIKDLFIVGCKTGLRYSDYSRITENHIHDDMIYIKTQKTKTDVCIPMDKYVKAILKKYGGQMPPARSIQYFNRVIKEVCQKAGLTDIVHFEEIKNGKINQVVKEKWEIIASHTARRTFISNMIAFKEQQSSIMKMTGHKTCSSFMRYNRLSIVDNARNMMGCAYFKN